MERPSRQRILEATYACVARWGVAKTTIEDAAREAGLSRATIYRYFPGGRDELIDAVVSWQFLEFFRRLYDEVNGAASLEEVLERGLVFARRQVLAHEVLQKVLETEPDVLVPKLTVESQRTVGLISGFLVPYLHEHGLPARGVGRRPTSAADFLARMILSYISAPRAGGTCPIPTRWRRLGPVRAAAWGGRANADSGAPIASRSPLAPTASGLVLLTMRQLTQYCLIVGDAGDWQLVRA